MSSVTNKLFNPFFLHNASLHHVNFSHTLWVWYTHSSIVFRWDIISICFTNIIGCDSKVFTRRSKTFFSESWRPLGYYARYLAIIWQSMTVNLYVKTCQNFLCIWRLHYRVRTCLHEEGVFSKHSPLLFPFNPCWVAWGMLPEQGITEVSAPWLLMWRVLTWECPAHQQLPYT